MYKNTHKEKCVFAKDKGTLGVVIQHQQRKQLELFISRVRISQRRETQQHNIRVLRSFTIMLCLFIIDFFWPHVVLNHSATNCLPKRGRGSGTLHSTIIYQMCTQLKLLCAENKEEVGAVLPESWSLCTNISSIFGRPPCTQFMPEGMMRPVKNPFPNEIHCRG